VDQGTQEGQSKFDQADFQNSKKHVAVIESELEDLRAICNNFTESSVSQSLDYKTTMESLKKEKDQAWEEVDKVVSCNKNQANLLQRLKKQLTQVENNSAQQIKEIQEQLQQERKKFMQLKKSSNGDIHMSMRNVFGSPPRSPGASVRDDASVNSSSNSPKPFSAGLTKEQKADQMLKDNK
jgi:homospermidine synthase